MWIWQHDKRTDDDKIILNCVRKLTKNKSEKEAGKAQALKKLGHTLYSKFILANKFIHQLSVMIGTDVYSK